MHATFATLRFPCAADPARFIQATRLPRLSDAVAAALRNTGNRSMPGARPAQAQSDRPRQATDTAPPDVPARAAAPCPAAAGEESRHAARPAIDLSWCNAGRAPPTPPTPQAPPPITEDTCYKPGRPWHTESHIHLNAIPRDKATVSLEFLNGAAVDEHGNRITCARLSQLWLMAREEHEHAKRTGAHPGHFVDVLIDAFRNADAIRALSAARPERTGEHLEFQCLRRIAHEGWGAFLAQQAQAMGPMAPGQSGARYFLVSIGCHALAVMLKTKTDAAGHAQHVVTVFDPNRTHSHGRHVFDSLETLKLTGLDHFVTRGGMAAYAELSSEEDPAADLIKDFQAGFMDIRVLRTTRQPD